MRTLLYEEVNYYFDSNTYTPNQDTNPTNSDTDGDGFLDGMEVASQYDPLDVTESPTWGDIDNDGIVNVVDVLLASRYVLELSAISSDEIARANVAPLLNGKPQYPSIDGLNTADLLIITRKALGLLNF